MKKIVFLLSSSLVILGLFFFTILTISTPTLALDGTPKDPCSTNIGIDSSYCTGIIPVNDYARKGNLIKDLAINVVNWLLIATGILAVAMIIISGLQIITSTGNTEKITKAKKTLLYSVIGLAIALLAAVIVNLTVYLANNIIK